MRALRLVMSSLAALVAGACDNVVIYYSEQTQPYSITFVSANAKDGLLPVKIYGDPSPAAPTRRRSPPRSACRAGWRRRA